MARSWTLLQIRTRARFHADLEGTDVGATDLRVNDVINANLCLVYLELVKAGPPDYFSTDFAITTNPAQLLPHSYALPADFLSCDTVFAHLGAVGRRPIEEIQGDQLVLYQPPTGVYTVTMQYIPTAPTLVNDGDSFDGVAGFEEAICRLTARDLLQKESSQAAPLDAEGHEILGRIRRDGRRSKRPQRITDLSYQEDNWWLTTNRIRAYRIRASAVELYEGRTVFP